MNNEAVSNQDTSTVDTSPTAYIRRVVSPEVIADALGFECMECGVPMDFEYLGGHLDMNGKEYHQLDTCDCEGEWSDRILVTIRGVRA